jgi:pimeloyl-ACP methyl ester carboxylesterase
MGRPGRGPDAEILIPETLRYWIRAKSRGPPRRAGVIEGAGHFVQLEKTAALNEVLERTLSARHP